jgi:hypothetical protein
VDNLTAALREIAVPPQQPAEPERYFALVIRKDSAGAVVTRCIEITKDLATRTWA